MDEYIMDQIQRQLEDYFSGRSYELTTHMEWRFDGNTYRGPRFTLHDSSGLRETGVCAWADESSPVNTMAEGSPFWELHAKE